MTYIDTSDEEDPDFFDDILATEKAQGPDKSRLEPSSENNARWAFSYWKKFCTYRARKMPERYSDPNEALKRVDIDEIKIFMRYYLTKHRKTIQKETAFLVIMRFWRSMYRQQLGYFIDPEITVQMTDYIQATLTPEFGLSKKGREKPVMSVEDFFNLMTHHWCLSNAWYHTERDRIQHGLFLILTVGTGARPSALVATRDYSDDGLRYKDIELFIVHDNNSTTKRSILMRVTLRLMKGRRNAGVPKQFVFPERYDNFAFCAILHVLTLAFTDNAFSSEYIRTPADIYEQEIPDRLKSVPIHWKRDMAERPVLREAVKLESGYQTDPSRVMTYPEILHHTTRLGRETGFRAVLTPYALRRGAGQAMDKNLTPAVRNGAMGQTTGVYERHYAPSVISGDTVSYFLGGVPKDALVRIAAQMSLTRDPDAQEKVKEIVDRECQTLIDAEMTELEQKIRCCKGSIMSTGTIKAASGTPEGKEYKQLLARKCVLRIRLRRESTARTWDNHFATIGDQVIEAQRCGHELQKPSDFSPKFALPERQALAKLMCNNYDVQNTAQAALEEKRDEALQALLSLCRQAEPRPTNLTATNQCSRKRSLEPDEIPTVEGLLLSEFTARHCPWCFYNTAFSTAARNRSYEYDSSLLRHIHVQHLTLKTYGKEATCPFVDCPFSPASEESLKNHLALAHTTPFSKKKKAGANAVRG